jgi:hypothetical protein
MQNKFCIIIITIVILFLALNQVQGQGEIINNDVIQTVLIDNSDAPTVFDTTRIYGPPSLTATFRDVAIGKNFKGPSDDTVRIFTVMSANPCYALLMNDTTKNSLKPNESGWQRHGANGRFIDSSLVGYHGASVGDVNHDGYTDMLYARGSGAGGPYRLFRAWWNGSNWQRETLSSFVGPINEIAIGDADNDGSVDIIFPAGNAVFRMRWSGSAWQRDSIYSGDGSICYSVAIGDVDSSSTRIGNEIYAVTEGQRLVQIYRSGTSWTSIQIDLYTNDVDFYDIAIGDFYSGNAGNEIVINNGKNFGLYGHLFIYYGSNNNGWWRSRLTFSTAQWGTYGEIVVGDVYDLHSGDEIVVTTGSQASGGYPMMVWDAGTGWYGRYLPNNQGGSTYGVAIGDVNKHRPPIGVPLTSEIVYTTGVSRSIYECEQRVMFNNDVAVDSVFLSPVLATVEDSITVQMKIRNLGYVTQTAIPVFYDAQDAKFNAAETCHCSLTYGSSVLYEFRTKFYPGSPGLKTVRCSTALDGEEYVYDDVASRSIQVYGVLSGMFTVGLDGDFNLITDALSAWKNSVITGDVIFRMTDNEYSTNETYPLVCTMPVGYRNGSWSLQIKPAGTSMPLISGTNSNAIFDLKSINHLTLDSLSITNSALSGPAIRLSQGASNNRINKCDLRANNTSTGVVFFSQGSATSGNNGNIISYCVIHNNTSYPGYGVFFNGSVSPADNRDDSIIGCNIYNFSSYGIWLNANAINSVIAENDIYTQDQQSSSNLQGIVINSNTVGGTKIISNKIHDFWTSHSSSNLRGIYLSNGSTSLVTLIANNFISIDATRTHPIATIYGIFETNNAGARYDICFNSIYIGGNNLTDVQFSYGVNRSSASLLNLKNNIIFNNRTHTNNYGKHSTIYGANTQAGLVSDNNDLYVSDPGGVSGQLLVYWYPASCTTLAQWQNLSGQDSNSISANPDFFSNSNLHISQNSVNVDRKGVPITGIAKDIDGQQRHSLHPDIGADEYTPNPPLPFSLISPDSNATWQRLYGQLVWHKSSLAEFYDVYLDTINPPQIKVSGFQSDTFYNYLHLLQTRTYFWQVVAHNDTNPLGLRSHFGEGSSDALITSSIWNFTTVTLPVPPSNLRLSQISNSGMKLTWHDNSSDETGFYIRRDTASSGLFPIIDSVSVNDTIYVAVGLQPNTHYYWQVSAFNFWGETDVTVKDTFTLAQVPGVSYITDVGFTSMKIYLSLQSNPANTKLLVKVTDEPRTNFQESAEQSKSKNVEPKQLYKLGRGEAKSVRYLNPSGTLDNDTVWATYADFGGVNGKMVIGLLCNTAYTFETKARNQYQIETNFGPSVTRATLPALELPFGESFEDTTFPPYGWHQEVIVSGGTNWSRVTSGTNPAQTPYHGSAQIRYNSYNAPNGANARLITPPLDLSSSPQADLKFYMYHNNIAGNDSIVIETSSDYGLTWQRLDRINRYSSTNQWQQHVLSLDGSIGNITVIAFHAFSANGNNIFLDSIAVEPLADVMVSAITRPYSIEQKRVQFISQVTVNNSSSQIETIPVKSEIWQPGSGFSECFEGTIFPPTGWVVYNIDGGAERWKRNTTNPYIGNACVASSADAGGLRNDDWLVSSQINIPTSDEFRFWYRTSAVGNDSLEIWLSNTGNAIGNFTVRLAAFGVRNTVYSERVISLSSYAGQNVYITFVNKGLNQGTIYLDHITINYEASILLYQDSDTVVVAGNEATQEVYFRPCTLMIEGEYQFKSYTELSTDRNPLNDLMIRNFVVQSIQLVLNTPLNGAFTNDSTPLFDWGDITGATQYRIQVASDSNFNSLEIDTITTNSYWQISDDDFLAENQYFWRVKVELPVPSDPYSDVWRLIIDTEEPVAPVLSLPLNGYQTNNVRPTFIWNKVSDAMFYNLIISSDKDIVIDTIISDTAHQITQDLTQASYSWQVRSRDWAGNWSLFSEIRTLVIDLTLPQPPILITPAHNTTVNIRTPTFVWSSVEDAVQYNLLIVSVKDTIVDDTTCTIALNRGTFRWRVRARDLAGNWSDFTGERIFTIQVEWVPQHPILPAVTGKFVKDGGALVTVDTLIYAFCGNKSNEFYQYSLGIDNWTPKETISFGLKPGYPDKINKKRVSKGAALCYDGDSIIYATKGNSTFEFWAYNTNQNIWTAKTYIPSVKGAKGGTSLLFYNGQVYLLAGGQKVNFDNFFVYTPTTNTWQSLTKTLFTPDNKAFRDGSCLALANDTIYALKGSGKDNYFYAYDVTANSWSNRQTIPLIHPQLINKKNKVKNGGAMASDNNLIYAIKGNGKQDFWSYSNNTWTPLCTIPRVGVTYKKSVPKAGAALTYANNAVWLLKGNKTLEYWKYIPSVEKSKVNRVSPKASAVTQSQKSKVTQSVIASGSEAISNLSQLFEISPNPLTEQTTIRYNVQVSGSVSLKLYNSSGRVIETLLDQYQTAGSYSLIIDIPHLHADEGQDCKLKIPHGIYFLRYESKTNKVEKKLIVQ